MTNNYVKKNWVNFKPGLVPVTYMNKHLGDKNLRMRHHYLGGNGTKPIARALEVMFYCQVIFCLHQWTGLWKKSGTTTGDYYYM
jgi:hypothetical protein